MSAGTPELALWKGAGVRMQPRDRRGRFVRVVHNPARHRILITAAKLRAQMGLPADPRLPPLEGDGA